MSTPSHPPDGVPAARPSPAVREWVLHGLACLPLGGHPATLHERAYLAHARDTLPKGCDDALREDGPALATRLLAREGLIFHALPAAFDSIEALRRCARAPGDRALEGVRHEILAGCLAVDPDLTEWLLIDLALGARAFASHYDRTIEPALRAACERLGPTLAIAGTVDPSLAFCALELSSVLGPRGRALGSRTLLAGAPAPWSAHAETHIAIQWLHERAVQAATERDYVRAEWSALTSLARRVEGTALRRAHAEWVRGLDLRSLTLAARALGLVASEGLADALLRGALEPADALRACATHAPSDQ